MYIDQTDSQTTETRFQCRHIHTDGHRCGSPSLRHKPFCYYHHTARKPVLKQELKARQSRRDSRERKDRRAAFDLPRPEDRSAMQAAIGKIPLRRAGLLLYGLQIASINLPPRQPAQDPAHTEEAAATPFTLNTLQATADPSSSAGASGASHLASEIWGNASNPHPSSSTFPVAPFSAAACPAPASSIAIIQLIGIASNLGINRHLDPRLSALPVHESRCTRLLSLF